MSSQTEDPNGPAQPASGVVTDEGTAVPAAQHRKLDADPQALLNRIIPRQGSGDGVDELDRSARRRALLGQIGVPIMGIVLVVVFAIIADNFLTGSNIKDIFRQAALPCIVALGLTVVLAMGEFDLSLNGVAGVSTVLLAVLVSREGVSPILAILICLGAGVVIGVFNGVLVGYFGVAALIVTIAVNSILNGWQFVFSGGSQIFGGFPESLPNFARGTVAGIPNLVIVAAVVAVVTWVLLERTTLGRQLRAVGGNTEAARIAGVKVARVKLYGFVVVAVLASLAGLLFAARETNAYALNGLDVLLPSFAACFIGAAMFKLGEFNVPGTVVGVLIAQITSNGLILMNVPTYASYFFQGIILLVALLFARLVVTAGRST